MFRRNNLWVVIIKVMTAFRRNALCLFQNFTLAQNVPMERRAVYILLFYL